MRSVRVLSIKRERENANDHTRDGESEKIPRPRPIFVRGVQVRNEFGFGRGLPANYKYINVHMNNINSN